MKGLKSQNSPKRIYREASLDLPKLNQGNYVLNHNESSKEIGFRQWNSQIG